MWICCVEEWTVLNSNCIFKTPIWLMLVSGIVCFVCLIHVLNWLKYKILYKILVLLVDERKENVKFKIWKFTRSLVWNVVIDWLMMFLVLWLTNKCTWNDFVIQIDDWSVGWIEKLNVEIVFSNWTLMTSGKWLIVFLMLLVWFITILIWNNWFEGIDWC